MSIQQKILQSQGLTDYETAVVDNSPTSKYFKVFSLDDTIPGGRSTFQILGSEYLENDVEIKIELIDINGNPVYIEPIKYLGDDPSRHIMIEVYPTTTTGVGTLTILGSLIAVPPEWKGVYNVKWEKEVFIDPVAKNIQPIFFRGQGVDLVRNQRYPLPEVEVVETVTGVVVASGSGGNDFVTSSIFDGGNYDGNASPFARPMHIGDLINARTQESSINGPPTNMGHAGIGSGQTAKSTYAAKPKNQQNTSDTTAIETNVVEQKYEEFHKPQAEPSPPPTPPIPLIASKPKIIPPPVETKAKQPDAIGKGTLIKRKTGEPFRLELAGGTFKSDPVVSSLVEGIKGRPFESSSFTASIVAVHSPDLLEIDSPYLIRDDRPEKDDSDPFIPVPHEQTSFTIDYEPVTTGSVSETILQSFAEITIKNMRTFSGDVHRIKTFAKGFSTQGDFKLVSDKLVEASDVLINTGSVSLSQKIGKFVNQIHIENNWQTKHIRKGTNVSTTSGTGSMIFSSTTSPPLMNAVLISGSNWKADESIVFETTTPKIKLRPNVDYNLSVNAILKTGEKDIFKDEGIVESQSRAKVRFYVSGSKLSQNLKGLKVASTGSIGNYLGDPIKVIQGEDESQGEVITLESDDNELGKNIDFGRVNIPFRPQFSGSGVTINDDTKLQVEVEAGQLYIQSIELTPATDTNFNPDEFRFIAPMPKLRKRPDLFDFLIEFYDRNGNKAGYTTIKEAVEFDGENDVIQGTNNLLTGSLSIGNAIGVGIEAAGINSAFIRSVGYVGFTSASVVGSGGFMMFSGSVLPDSPDSYQGVGLEIHDGNSGSFKFRTHNADGVGEFDVRTNKFFFGKTGVQFISGSDDQIEISSSNFHLQGDGTLTIGADANILGGLTADSILVPAGSTTTNALASIASTGAARFTSASIGGFEVTDAHISSSGLVLKSSGQITGSNFLLQGGTITSDVTIDAGVSANSLSLPSSGTKLAIVTALGHATFSRAEIGSFKISDQEIRSLSGSLILSASGAITASDVLVTGNITANAGAVFQDFTRLHDTTGSLESDASASVSRSIGIEQATSSLFISASDVRTSLTSSKTESDLVAKGFGEKAVVSASNFAQGAEATASALAQGAEASASAQVTESIEFTREQTGSLKDFSFGAAQSGSAASTQSRLDAVATASADVTTKVTSLNTTITGSFVPVKADMSSSIAEIVEVQVETSSSKFGLASSIVQLTSSFSQVTASLAESKAFTHTVSASVMASASAEFVASASILTDNFTGTVVSASNFGAKAVLSASAFAAGAFKSSSVGANASHSLVIAESSQSRFEVDTLQSETTTSLNRFTAIAGRSASMDATISASFTLVTASVDFAATGSQVKSLGFASESITRADTSSSFAVSKSNAGLASASVGIDFAATGSQVKSLGFASESITRADVSASLVSASSVVAALGFATASNVKTDAGLAPIKTDFTQSRGEVTKLQLVTTQSRFEVDTLQTETTASRFSLASSITQLTSSLSAIGSRSASMDATISSSFTLSSASLAFSSSILSGSIGTKINPYETQVSLSGDGLAIKKLDETMLAKYGETTELFAGGSTADRAILDTSGLALISGSVTGAFFGGTTIIGPESSTKSRVEISAGSVKIMHHTSSILTFDDSGDVTSESGFILERTRLFGAGGDGVITLKHNTATVSTGSGLNGAGKADSTSVIVNEQGTTLLTRVGTVWSLRGDLYADSLELDNSTGTAPTLVTSGSRIFVKNEFKIDSSCIVHNDATAGEDGADAATSDNSIGDTPTLEGAGGKGNALSAGIDGKAGGRGGNPGTGGTYYGGNGGGAGGSGGIIFISARLLVNSGSIRSLGGDGGAGGDGVGALPGAGSAPAAGGAGAAGSIVNIKV
jgi:hypothetical protein